MTRSLAAVCFTVGAVVAAARGAPPADDKVVYTRAEALSLTTGEVRLRTAYTVPLELPWPECDGESFSCDRDEVYGQVYSLEFHETHVASNPDEERRLERVPRGQSLIAMALDPEDEDRLEADLQAHIESLNVAAFSRPRAGMGYMRGPFANSMLRRSDLPVYVCEELDQDHVLNLMRLDERDRAYAQGGETARRACRALEATVAELPEEVHTTMPEIGSLRRQEVRLKAGDTLTGLTWADELAAIPAGATFEKCPSGDRRTGGVRDRRDGVFIGREGRYHDVERHVTLPTGELELLERPMWVSRWTIIVTDESFGETHQQTEALRETLYVAVVPIEDPLMPELTRAGTPLGVPGEDAIAAAVVERLGRRANIDSKTIASGFNEPALWRASGDWMLVACSADGSARYGIAPFAFAADVENPRETCAAIRRALGE